MLEYKKIVVETQTGSYIQRKIMSELEGLLCEPDSHRSSCDWLRSGLEPMNKLSKCLMWFFYNTFAHMILLNVIELDSM